MAFDNSGISGDLVIPNSVTEVGHRAFCLCSNLTGSLTLPDFMTLIDDYAFCSPFTGELVIPNRIVLLRFTAMLFLAASSVRSQ